MNAQSNIHVQMQLTQVKIKLNLQ